MKDDQVWGVSVETRRNCRHGLKWPLFRHLQRGRWTQSLSYRVSKSEREKQISHVNAYMWNVGKWYGMKLFPRQEQRCRHREWTWRHRHGGGRGGQDELREQDRHVHTITCKTDSQWERAVQLRELSSVLCNDLEGWEVQEGGDICAHMADSL